jgi:ppGpp synthetase/RelA/SpoT-type nucleotidyltranferase
LAARQIAQPEISNSHSHEPFHFVTDRIKHPPNLLINSLPKDHAQSRRSFAMNLRHLRALTIQENSAQKFLG